MSDHAAGVQQAPSSTGANQQKSVVSLLERAWGRPASAESPDAAGRSGHQANPSGGTSTEQEQQAGSRAAAGGRNYVRSSSGENSEEGSNPDRSGGTQSASPRGNGAGGSGPSAVTHDSEATVLRSGAAGHVCQNSGGLASPAGDAGGWRSQTKESNGSQQASRPAARRPSSSCLMEGSAAGAPPKKAKPGSGKLPRPEGIVCCPRCQSEDTKFCYYNNYNVNQPRYFCKACQRYWTAGGTLRNVPVGSGRRKNKTGSKVMPESSVASDSTAGPAAARSAGMPEGAPLSMYPFQLLDPQQLYGAAVGKTALLDPQQAAAFAAAQFVPAMPNPALNGVAPIGSFGAAAALPTMTEHLRALSGSAGGSFSFPSLPCGPADSTAGGSTSTYLLSAPAGASACGPDAPDSEDGSSGGRRVRQRTDQPTGSAFAPPASVAAAAPGEAKPAPSSGAAASGASQQPSNGFKPTGAGGNLSGLQGGVAGAGGPGAMEWLSYAAAANHQQQQAALQAQAQLQAAAAAGWSAPSNMYLNGLAAWQYGLYNNAAPGWASYASRFGPAGAWMDPTAAAAMAAAAQAQAAQQQQAAAAAQVQAAQQQQQQQVAVQQAQVAAQQQQQQAAAQQAQAAAAAQAQTLAQQQGDGSGNAAPSLSPPGQAMGGAQQPELLIPTPINPVANMLPGMATSQPMATAFAGWPCLNSNPGMAWGSWPMPAGQFPCMLPPKAMQPGVLLDVDGNETAPQANAAVQNNGGNAQGGA